MLKSCRGHAKAGAWLVSTLVWLPLFIPALAMEWKAMPVSYNGPLPSLLIGVGWVLIGFWGTLDYAAPARWRLIARLLFGLSVLMAIKAVFIILNQGELVNDGRGRCAIH